MTASLKIFGVEAAAMLSELQRISFQGSIEQLWSREEFETLFQITGTEAIVYVCKNKPIGFLLSRGMAGEAEILTICVLPEHRNKGISSQMLKKLIHRSAQQEIGDIVLEVRENNHAAIILYEKNGFDIVGKRKGYYSDGKKNTIDALVMQYSVI